MSGPSLQGCQSTNHGRRACYGELWQCGVCGKTVCYAEGTDNDPSLCDDCWVKKHGGKDGAQEDTAQRQGQ